MLIINNVVVKYYSISLSEGVFTLSSSASPKGKMSSTEISNLDAPNEYPELCPASEKTTVNFGDLSVSGFPF